MIYYLSYPPRSKSGKWRQASWRRRRRRRRRRGKMGFDIEKLKWKEYQKRGRQDVIRGTRSQNGHEDIQAYVIETFISTTFLYRRYNHSSESQNTGDFTYSFPLFWSTSFSVMAANGFLFSKTGNCRYIGIDSCIYWPPDRPCFWHVFLVCR